MMIDVHRVRTCFSSRHFWGFFAGAVSRIRGSGGVRQRDDDSAAEQVAGHGDDPLRAVAGRPRLLRLCGWWRRPVAVDRRVERVQ